MLSPMTPTSPTPVQGALMVVGATSAAGKSTVTSALCRAWAREGADVAPFKAQNMSNHSAVTADGGEIGRAQAMQALAARVAPDRRMNPVLLKPAADHTSHLVVLGREDTGRRADARGYGETARQLRPMVLEALTSLRREHGLIVAEGAGGAAEINLLDRDLVNLPLAAAAGIPALLVVDIERGGAFASAYGTLALLPDRLRECVRGIAFNRFRGDPSLLEDGVRELEARAGVPVLGVLPHLGSEPMLGVEDSLDLEAFSSADAACTQAGSRPLRVAVIRLPHLANPSDVDPLVLEPQVSLRWATNPGDLAEADLVIVPGSRATVADLTWVRARGLDAALARVVAETSAVVVGLCAGYQMLGRTIDDPIESRAGQVAGLGLLPCTTEFREPKVVTGSVGEGVQGYQIRFGRPSPDAGAAPWLTLDDGPEGCVSTDGRVRGTSLHGLLDADGFRRELLAEVAARRDRDFVPAQAGFAAAREAHLDLLADWVSAHLPLDRLAEIAAGASAPQAAPGW